MKMPKQAKPILRDARSAQATAVKNVQPSFLGALLPIAVGALSGAVKGLL